MGAERLRAEREREQTELILYKFEFHPARCLFTVHLATGTKYVGNLFFFSADIFHKKFLLIFLLLQILLNETLIMIFFNGGRSAPFDRADFLPMTFAWIDEGNRIDEICFLLLLFFGVLFLA
ncbi:hypothetical protein V8C37DRAFT_180686 [Trichoderma ceciliae]